MDLSAHQREWLDSAGNEISKRDARIRELEAEVERMRPLVDVVCSWADGYDEGRIGEDAVLTEVTEYYGRVAAYEASQPK